MLSAGAAHNFHATAIVLGTTGLLFTGPSGSGKSSMAFACLNAARQAGLYAALIADDQVFIEQAGPHIIARRPETIACLMEFRGTGIEAVESLPSALMHAAVRCLPPGDGERLPPETECLQIGEGLSLPLVRILTGTADPFSILRVFLPITGGNAPHSGPYS